MRPIYIMFLITLHSLPRALSYMTFSGPASSSIDEGVDGTSWSEMFETNVTVVTCSIPGPAVGQDPNPSQSKFEVTGDGSGNCVLTLRDGELLDYETHRNFTVILKAESPSAGLTVSTTIQIFVNDLDDTPPTVEDQNFTVGENHSPGDRIGNVRVIDLDSQPPFTFTMTGDPKLRIDTTSGEIFCLDKLDYEAQSIHRTTVTVTDSNFNSASANVSLLLTDLNDEMPTCNPAFYFISLPEGTPKDTNVTKVKCTDADISSDFNTLEYSMVSGDTSPPVFTIDPVSGAISTTAVTADYEQQTSFTLIVAATENNASFTATSTVFVQVTDINEDPPTWSSSGAPRTVHIFENVSVGQEVVTLLASDTDGNTPCRYYIISTIDENSTPVSGVFVVDETEGTIIIGKPLERDGPTGHSAYTVTVEARDSGTPSRSVTGNVTVIILDVNEYPPQFTSSLTFVTLEELAQVGTVVANLSQVVDADSTAGTPTYQITDGNEGGKFVLDVTSSPPTVLLNSTIEPDQPVWDPTLYTLYVTATDSIFTSTTTIIVEVIKINEEGPSWTEDGTPRMVEVYENISIGETLFTVAAFDRERNTSCQFGILSIRDESSSPADGMFLINSATGDIQVVGPLDRDGPTGHSAYTVTVEARDSGTPSRSVTGNVTVIILDVNEYPPQFTSSLTFVTLEELAQVGTVVANLSQVVDADSAAGTPTYQITDGNEGGKFVLDVTSSPPTVLLNSTIEPDQPVWDPTLYTLYVTATDSVYTSTATIVVEVIEVNEEGPSWTEAGCPRMVELYENVSIAETVFTVAALDSERNIPCHYRILDITDESSSPADGMFLINSATGDIQVVRPLDRDGPTGHSAYTVTVEARDSGTPSRSVTGNVTVIILDVNEYPPQFTSSLTFVTLEELAQVGTVVANLSQVVDADSTAGTPTYQITDGNEGGKFVLDMTSSPPTVLLNSTIEPDQPVWDPTLYTLYVTVTDSVYTSTTTIIVQIELINDNAPSLVSVVPDLIKINEATASGEILAEVSFKDNDGGQDGEVLYYIQTGNMSDHFSIDSRTGTIFLQRPIDYDTLLSHERHVDLTVIILDGGRGPERRNGTTTASVTIEDVNDNLPVCVPTLPMINVFENEAMNSTLQQFTCTDADPTPAFNTVTCTLTVTPDTGVFNMEKCILKLLGILDYETTTFYNFTMTYTDGLYYETVAGIINILPINEAGPSFNGSFNISVPEDVAVGTVVLQVLATDIDGPNHPHGALSYSLSGGDNKFYISPSTAEITVAQALDFEEKNMYILNIIASERVGTNSAATVVRIEVEDTNDNSPVCSTSFIVTSVPEDIPANTSLPDVFFNCTDQDSGNNSDLSYTILNTEGIFNIINQGPQVGLRLVGELDYETTQRHLFSVVVTDGGQKSTEVAVTVVVLNVNEHAPKIVTPSGGKMLTVTVPEDIETGQVIYSLNVTDDDLGVYEETVWSIRDGNHDNCFIIEKTSGQLRVAAGLDRETTGRYDLLIRVSNSLDTSSYDTVTSSYDTVMSSYDEVNVTIIVSDVNDNPPVFDSEFCAAATPETTPHGSIVMSVNTSDKDIDTNSEHSFSIRYGNENNTFKMTNNSLVLQSVGPQDIGSHKLVICATDAGTPALTTCIDCILTINLVNKYAPFCHQPTDAIEIAENTAFNTVVFSVEATDKDEGAFADLHFNMSMISSGGEEKFLITVDGKIYVGNDLDYDAEQNVFVLMVTVTDTWDEKFALTDICNITIILTDVNDNRPVFLNQTYITEIPENIAGNTSVLMVTAQDADSGTNADITYSIVGGLGSEMFTINKSSGEVRVIAYPDIDYEERKTHVLVAIATDSGTPPRTGTTDVIIQVTDTNDNEPHFSRGYTTISVMENSYGFDIFNISATDRDVGRNNEFIFLIRQAKQHLNISKQGDGMATVTLVQPFDREVSEMYMATVIAVDKGDPPLTGTTTLYVFIDDVNDNAPFLVPTEHARDVTIMENTKVGTLVCKLNATDTDRGENGTIRFEIVYGSDDVFWVDVNSGDIYVVNETDREARDLYELFIVFRDEGSPTLYNNVTITVHISDFNDNSPVLLPPFTLCMHAWFASNESIFTAIAIDADIDANSHLTWSLSTLIGDNDGAVIGQTSGDVHTRRPLVADSLHVFHICASDNGNPPQKSCKDYIIDVHPPCTQGAIHIAAVAENAEVNTFIAMVTPSAPVLAGTNVTYKMADDSHAASDVFALNETSGVLYVVRGCDREQNDRFYFQIVVLIWGRPYSYDDVWVTCTDTNDNRPTFPVDFKTTQIDCLTSNDKLIIDLVTIDPDGGENGTVTYHIMTADGTEQSFEIRGATLWTRPDYQLACNMTYLLQIEAVDGGTPPMTSPSPLAVRLDTFERGLVTVLCKLAISRLNFLQKLDIFRVNMARVVQQHYPDMQVHILEFKGQLVQMRPILRRRYFTEHTFVSLFSRNVVSGEASPRKFLPADDFLVLLVKDGSVRPHLHEGDLASFGIYEISKEAPSLDCDDCSVWILASIIMAASLLLLIAVNVTVVILCWGHRANDVRPMEFTGDTDVENVTDNRTNDRKEMARVKAEDLGQRLTPATEDTARSFDPGGGFELWMDARR